MNIYDCKIATTNSKKNKMHNNPNNKNPKIAVININPEMLLVKIKKIKPDTTCNKICPANTLAKSRNDKLTTLNV